MYILIRLIRLISGFNKSVVVFLVFFSLISTFEPTARTYSRSRKLKIVLVFFSLIRNFAGVKKKMVLVVGCWLLSLGMMAQDKKRQEVDMDSPTFVPTVKVGKVLEDGDSIQYMEMNNVYVFPPVTFSRAPTCDW